MAYNTFQIRLDYDMEHRKNSPINFRNVSHNIPNSTNLRDFLLDIVITPIGYHHASGVVVELYKPRTHYVESGTNRPIDKWGTYPINTNAIPPLATVVSTDYAVGEGVELRINTPDSEWDLVKWTNKYWTLVPGSFWRDQIDDPANYDRLVNPGWPGYRNHHTLFYGFAFSDFKNNADATATTSPANLRLTSHITGFGEKYMLLITLWRGKRTIKKAMQFSLLGSAINGGLLSATYIPVAIVYSPPGQDMSNSMVESTRHGTRFSFVSTDISAGTSAMGTSISGAIGLHESAGIGVSHEDSATDSQQTTDTSTSIINVWKKNETMITANNRTSIGRAYWGPLGDLFVIIKDLLFYGYQAFDEGTGIVMVPMPSSPNARKLILSTRELLIPENESAAKDIPWDQRKRILKLNPFVVDNDAILDQVANGSRPLEDAVNPDADPNGGSNPTRAIKVLSLDLGKGSEVNFYESLGVQISRVETHATNYTTKFKSETNFRYDLSLPINVGFGTGFSTDETISYQTTSELREDDHLIKTAKCYLIRNQNDATDGFLDIYYDTIFGTFLFSKREKSNDCIRIVGKVSGSNNFSIPDVSVRILDKDMGIIARSRTNANGIFRIPCVKESFLKGKIFIQAGDKREEFKVSKEMIKKRIIRKDIANTKRLIDLGSSTYEEVMEIFDLDLEQANRFSHALSRLKDEEDVLSWLGLSKKQRGQFRKSNKIIWTEESRKQLAKRGKRPPQLKKRKARR